MQEKLGLSFSAPTVLLLLACSAPRAILGARSSARGQACDHVRATVGELSKFAITEESDSRLPPQVSGLLDRLKGDVEALTVAVLGEHPKLGDNPSELRSALIAALGEAGAGLPRNGWDYWGQIVNIGCSNPAPRVLAVIWELAVVCGSDTTLFVFERGGRAWRLSVVGKTERYAEINGAQGDFWFAVSPLDPTGHFWVVTARVNPWCSSNWQGLFTRVLRPSADPHTPRVLLQRKDIVFMGDELEFYTLHVLADRFTLKFKTHSFLDNVRLVGSRVLTFRVDDSTVTRVAPIADRPDDFIDEWARLPWPEALEWTMPAAREQAERWHEALQSDAEGAFSQILEPVRCPGEGERWEVAYDPDSSDESDADLMKATVVRKDGAFFLAAVGRAEFPCGATQRGDSAPQETLSGNP